MDTVTVLPSLITIGGAILLFAAYWIQPSADEATLRELEAAEPSQVRELVQKERARRRSLSFGQRLKLGALVATLAGALTTPIAPIISAQAAVRSARCKDLAAQRDTVVRSRDSLVRVVSATRDSVARLVHFPLSYWYSLPLIRPRGVHRGIVADRFRILSDCRSGSSVAFGGTGPSLLDCQRGVLALRLSLGSRILVTLPDSLP
jgi:hypothetical protein